MVRGVTRLLVKRLHPAAVVPTYGSDGAIGLDLTAVQAYVLEHGEVAAIGTGLAFAIPPGYYGRIAPRSGLAAKKGVDVLGGVIDEDYRGEVKVLLTSHLKHHGTVIEKGDKIAQLILERADRLPVQEAEILSDTLRGANGFGSTGR